MTTRIQQRRGTAAQWTTANPVLAAGEEGYETDTGKQKVGNGATAWSSLSYQPTPADIANLTGMASAALRRARVGFAGNSITQGAGAGVSDTYLNPPGVQHAETIATFAMLSSDGRWELVTNAGVGGEKSDQINARLATDIIAAGCTVCVLGEYFRNDIVLAYPAATSMANLATAVAQLRAAGVQPVLVTPTPDAITAGSTAYKTLIADLCRRLVTYAAAEGLPLIDWHTPLADPATGNLAAAYNSDNSVHMNTLANHVLGAATATVLDSIIPPTPPLLVDYAANPRDLLGGIGLFATDTNADGIANGWTSGVTSGCTASRTTDPNVPGNMQRFTAVAAAADSSIVASIASGWAVGDVLEFSGLVSMDGGARATAMIVVGGSPTPYSNMKTVYVARPITRGRWRHRFTIPSGSTALAVYLYVRAGTGVVEYGQVQVANLTTLGAL